MFLMSDLSPAQQSFERIVWGRRQSNVPEDELAVAYETGVSREQRIANLLALREHKALLQGKSTRIALAKTPARKPLKRRPQPHLEFATILSASDVLHAHALGIRLD